MLVNTDFASFQYVFEHKLGAMLSPDELGAFILVLANSMQDIALQQGLAVGLKEVFAAIDERAESGALNAAADDLAVFEKLRETGIADYGCWKLRQLDNWLCAYNPLRALRPARSSSESFAGLSQPFNERGFHFDKDFLRPEILSEEMFQGESLRIMYHKFPCVAYHLLILPSAEKHRAQYLDEDMHALAWDLVAKTGSTIPGFGAAFNSLGAGASVNHFHLHGFVQEDRFAIEDTCWQHNGGSESYPVSCGRFGSKKESWDAIADLHAHNQPYNLLFRPGECYLILRTPQGQRKLPEWMETAGWYELSGAFNLSDKNAFESLTAPQIMAGLGELRV